MNRIGGFMTISICSPTDATYPSWLREALQPAPTLYFRGSLPLTWDRSLAVVGSRKPTAYGRAVIQHLVPDLARAGVVIVSGLALGIDGLVHEAALSCGITVAVLGSGVDEAHITPRSHHVLSKKILQNNGAILSQYPPGSDAFKSHFPERNKIIAGLTRGTLVVEAAHQSGSLITALHAVEMNRDVWAVPGPITSAMSVGTNRLLKLGAIPALSAQQILRHYAWDNAPAPTSPIFQFLQKPQSVEAIAEFLHLSHSDALLYLLQQEVLGTIQKMGPNAYCRTPLTKDSFDK